VKKTSFLFFVFLFVFHDEWRASHEQRIVVETCCTFLNRSFFFLDLNLSLQLNEVISTCKTARDSSSSKERRELLAKLGNLLSGNDELLRALDANTESAAKLRRRGAERSKALTWTYVINTYFKLVEGELLAGGDSNAVGKKAALTNMGAAVRDVCRLADRRGRHLFDVIGSVFAHLLEVLEKHMDVFGSDYSHLLLDLFSVEAYSNVVELKQFTDLLQVYVDALVRRTPLPLVSGARARPSARAGGAAGVLAAMQLYSRVIHHLLQCYRADLTPMHKSLADAFAKLLTRIERAAEDEDDDFGNVNASDDVHDEAAMQRVAQVQWQRAARAYGANGRVSLLAAMATVALRCVQSGTDSPFWTPRIAALVCHAWPTVRQAEHKCTLLRFAHVQLRGAVPFCVAPSLSAAIGAAPLHGIAPLRRCFDAELERVGAAVASRRATNAVIWSGCFAKDSGLPEPRRLLACGADLYLYCEQLHAARPQVLKADVDDRVVKRPRALTPIGELRARAVAGGVAALPWLQLLHAVLLRVGDSALGDCVGRLALSAVVDELCERFKAAPTDDECFWLLACVHRALFASGAQRNSAGGGGAGAAPMRVSRARCGPRAWSTVVSHFGELGDEAQRAALVVLTTLLEMQLVDVAALDDARLGTVFGVSMFDAQRGRCEREQLRFVLAVLERTSLVDSMAKPESVDGAAAISWRHRLLLWLVAGATFAVPDNVSARTPNSAAVLVDAFVDVELWSRVFVSLHTSGVCVVAGEAVGAAAAGALDAVSPNAVRLAWRQHELALVDVPWERCSFVESGDATSARACPAPLADELFGVDPVASTSVRFDGAPDYERLRATYEDDQVARDMLRTRPLLGVFGARDAPLSPLPAHANAIDHAQRAALADLAKAAFRSLVERSLDACKGVLASKRRTLGIDESAFLLQLCHAVHLACAAAVIGGTASPCSAALERDAELLLQFVCDHLGELSAVGSTSDTRLLGRFCASLTQIVALANHCAPLRPPSAVLCDFVHRLLLDVSGHVLGDGAGAVALGAASQHSGMAADNDDGGGGGDLDEDFAQLAAAGGGVSAALTVTARQHVALMHECLATIGARGADATYEWADGVRWLSDFLARLFDSQKSDASTRLWPLSLSALQALARQRAFDTIDGPRDAQCAAVRARCIERLRALLAARRAAPAAMCVRALQQLDAVASDMRGVKDAESADVVQLAECANDLVNGLLDADERAGVHVATRRAVSSTLQALLRLPVELASFGDVLTAFLEMQCDADVGVRLGVARGITLFFDIYVREREILADIRSHMRSIDTVCACAAGECTCVVESPSMVATTLLTLAQVARVSEVNRAALVAEFVLWCSRPAQLGLFARHALTWLAGELEPTPPASAVLAHRAVARLLQRNMPAILDRFIPWPAVPNAVRLDVRTFPFDLCAPGMTMVQFAGTYAPELLQRLTLANDTEQIERLAGALSLTTQTLLVRHLGAVFGAAMPLYFVREEVPSSDASAVGAANKLARLAAEICEVTLPKLIDGDVSQFVPVQMPAIVTTMLDLCHSSDVGGDADDAAPADSLVVEVAPGVLRLPPAVVYSAAVIRRGFGYLSDSFGHSVSQMLFKGQHSDRVHTTTMHMRYRLARATTSLEQTRIVRALALFDAALENEALHAWTFAELANFYFDALLLSAAARDAAATALLALCRRAASGKLPTLEAQLARLVANLLACAPVCAPARACLRYLVVDCEQKMTTRIAALEPFVRDALASDSRDFDTMMLQLAAVHERVQPDGAVVGGGATASLSGSVAKRRRRESSRAATAAAVAALAEAPRDPLNDLQRMFASLLDKIGTDLPDAGALASLRGVANVLEVDPAQLRALVAASAAPAMAGASDARDDGAVAALLERVALRLVAFVSTMSHRGAALCERHGEAMRLAATILGHLRAFDAHAVAFAAAATGGGADLVAAVNRAVEPMSEYLRLTLIKLTELLQRRDPVLARMSGAALTALMRTVSGKNAYKLLAAAQAELVSPFVVSRASQNWREEMRKIGIDVDARAARYLRLDGRALPEPCPIATAAVWSVACGGGSGGAAVSGKSFDEWIRMLTYSLAATCVKDEALSVCAELCLYSAEFAEFCLPAILFDTCVGAAGGKDHQKRIARSIVRVALDADGTMVKSADAESRTSAPYGALLACVRNAEFVDAPLNDADLADESLVDHAPLDDETFTQKTPASIATQRERGSLLLGDDYVAAASLPSSGAVAPPSDGDLLAGSAVARQCLLLLDSLSVLFRVNLAMLRQSMSRAQSSAAGSSQSRGRGTSNQVGLWEQVWRVDVLVAHRVRPRRALRAALRGAVLGGLLRRAGSRAHVPVAHTFTARVATKDAQQRLSRSTTSAPLRC
jgi:hypothetical protein